MNKKLVNFESNYKQAVNNLGQKLPIGIFYLNIRCLWVFDA